MSLSEERIREIFQEEIQNAMTKLVVVVERVESELVYLTDDLKPSPLAVVGKIARMMTEDLPHADDCRFRVLGDCSVWGIDSSCNCDLSFPCTTSSTTGRGGGLEGSGRGDMDA